LREISAKDQREARKINIKNCVEFRFYNIIRILDIYLLKAGSCIYRSEILFTLLLVFSTSYLDLTCLQTLKWDGILANEVITNVIVIQNHKAKQ
jgi:hypothetical protein